jgi:hypothetical protein
LTRAEQGSGLTGFDALNVGRMGLVVGDMELSPKRREIVDSMKLTAPSKFTVGVPPDLIKQNRPLDVRNTTRLLTELGEQTLCPPLGRPDQNPVKNRWHASCPPWNQLQWCVSAMEAIVSPP